MPETIDWTPNWLEVFDFNQVPEEYLETLKNFTKYWSANYETYKEIVTKDDIAASVALGSDSFLKEIGHQTVNNFLRSVALIGNTRQAVFGDDAFNTLTSLDDKSKTILMEYFGADNFRYLHGMTHSLDLNLPPPKELFSAYNKTGEVFAGLFQTDPNKPDYLKPVTFVFPDFEQKLSPLQVLKGAVLHEVRHGGILSAEMRALGWGRSAADVRLWG